MQWMLWATSVSVSTTTVVCGDVVWRPRKNNVVHHVKASTSWRTPHFLIGCSCCLVVFFNIKFCISEFRMSFRFALQVFMTSKFSLWPRWINFIKHIYQFLCNESFSAFFGKTKCLRLSLLLACNLLISTECTEPFLRGKCQIVSVYVWSWRNERFAPIDS